MLPSGPVHIVWRRPLWRVLADTSWQPRNPPPIRPWWWRAARPLYFMARAECLAIEDILCVLGLAPWREVRALLGKLIVCALFGCPSVVTRGLPCSCGGAGCGLMAGHEVRCLVCGDPGVRWSGIPKDHVPGPPTHDARGLRMIGR